MSVEAQESLLLLDSILKSEECVYGQSPNGNEDMEEVHTLTPQHYCNPDPNSNHGWNHNTPHVWNPNPPPHFKPPARFINIMNGRNTKSIRRKEAITTWWKQTRNNMGLSDMVNIYHKCHEERCQEKGFIINPESNFYLCTESGLIHECGGQERCPEVLTTHNGTCVCIISAIEVDIVYQNDFMQNDYSKYGKVSENDYGYDNDSNVNSSQYFTEGAWGRIVSGINEKKKREEFLLSPNNRKKPRGHPSVKVIRSKADREKKIREKEFKKDPFGFNNSNSPYFNPKSDSNEIKKEITSTFKTLFFDNELREKVREENIKNFHKSWKNMTNSYFRECYQSGNKVSVTDLDRLFSECEAKNHIPESCTMDQKEILYLRAIIFKTWELLRYYKVIEDKTSVQFKEKFIYALLYIMKDSDYESLTWLKTWLPDSTELGKYSNSKRKAINFIREIKKMFMKKENREKFRRSDIIEAEEEIYNKHGRNYPLSWLFL